MSSLKKAILAHNVQINTSFQHQIISIHNEPTTFTVNVASIKCEQQNSNYSYTNVLNAPWCLVAAFISSCKCESF